MVVPTGASAVIRIWLGSVVGKNSTPVGATKKSAMTPMRTPSVAVSSRARLSVSKMYGEPNVVVLRPEPRAAPSAPASAMTAGSASIPTTTRTPLSAKWILSASVSRPMSTTTTPPEPQAHLEARPARPGNAVSRLWTTIPRTPTSSKNPARRHQQEARRCQAGVQRRAGDEQEEPEGEGAQRERVAQEATPDRVVPPEHSTPGSPGTPRSCAGPCGWRSGGARGSSALR